MPAKPASEQSAAPHAPEPTTANGQAQVPPTSGVAPDPMLWWAQLSQQFQTIASKTLTDIQNAQKAQADLAAKTAAQASPVTSPSAAKVQPRTKPAAAPLSKAAKAAKVNKVNKAKKAPLKTPAPNPERAASPSTPSPAAENTPHKVSNNAAKKSSSKSSNKATSKTSKKAPTPAKSAGASSASSKAQPKPRVNPSAFKGLDTLF